MFSVRCIKAEKLKFCRFIFKQKTNPLAQFCKPGGVHEKCKLKVTLFSDPFNYFVRLGLRTWRNYFSQRTIGINQVFLKVPLNF